MRTLALVGLIAFLSVSRAAIAADASAAGMDAASTSALVETQDVLKNPKARSGALSLSPMAPAVDNKVKQLGGSQQNTDDIYGLASDIFGTLMEEAGGDPLKAQQLMLEAERNPQAWASKWTPEQQAKLKALSGRLPASQGPASSGASSP